MPATIRYALDQPQDIVAEDIPRVRVGKAVILQRLHQPQRPAQYRILAVHARTSRGSHSMNPTGGCAGAGDVHSIAEERLNNMPKPAIMGAKSLPGGRASREAARRFCACRGVGLRRFLAHEPLLQERRQSTDFRLGASSTDNTKSPEAINGPTQWHPNCIRNRLLSTASSSPILAAPFSRICAAVA